MHGTGFLIMEQEKLNKNTEILEEGKQDNHKILTHCPYCSGKVVKKGKRKKKYEEVQVYYCKHCNKKFTSQITKHKTYPLRIIMDSLTLYNKLNSLNRISEMMDEKYGIKVSSQTISKWIKEYEKYASFLRMREFAEKKYDSKEIIEESKMMHNQIYHFKYHRAKLDMVLGEDYKHYRFKDLKEFLELINAECPHQLFRNTPRRASEFRDIFNLDEVKIVPKNNTAVKTANFVVQAVSNNKLRHEVLQEFMLANDSVTVATEVPVIIDSDDLRHYKHELNFDIPIQIKDNEYITGHIDIVQVRNGSVYIMDYKPGAKREKPIGQLTIYALALSRLTGIRLFHFKCGWFDDKDYFEFFPLHVVYKLKKGKRLPKEQTRLIKKG